MSKQIWTATEEQIAEIIQANDDGGYLTGGSPIEEIVNEWAGKGLTVEEVKGYIAARVFRGKKAVQLKEAGITPEQAATRTGSDVGIGCYCDSLGYKVANGDLSVEEAKAWLSSMNSAVDTIRELLLCPDYVSSDEWAYEGRKYSDEEWNNAIDAVARQYGRAPDPGWIEKVRAQLGLPNAEM